MLFSCVPDYIGYHVEIFMNENISHPVHLLLWDVWIEIFNCNWYVFACFPDDFKISDNCIDDESAFSKFNKRYCLKILSDFIDRL